MALWAVACQDPLSVGSTRQEYWSGLLCPPAGDLPNPGMEPMSVMSSALIGGFFGFVLFFTTSTIREAPEFLMLPCNSDIN